MRCCKDLGIASELWYFPNRVRSHAVPFMHANRDPRFNRVFRVEHCKEVFAEHVVTKKKFVPRLYLAVLPA